MNDRGTPPEGFRFSLRKLLIIVGVAAATFHCLNKIRKLPEVARDAYATWDGANLVIEYLRTHSGQWPQNWDDIAQVHRMVQGRMRGGQSIEELKLRLSIDFKVNPQEFAAADPSSPGGLPRAIRLRNGKDTCWEGAEPNTLIHQFLTDADRYLERVFKLRDNIKNATTPPFWFPGQGRRSRSDE
ncbi:MAG: hypothetical protein DCC67_05045, partial [Planctomycetota bacterium]